MKRYNIIRETDVDFYLTESEGVSTFEICPETGEIMRGVCYLENQNRYIHLSRHACLEDLYSSLEHEDLHSAIETCRNWERENDKITINPDSRQEHRIIYRMLNPDWYL